MSIAVEHERFILTAKKERKQTVWLVIHIVKFPVTINAPSGGRS